MMKKMLKSTEIYLSGFTDAEITQNPGPEKSFLFLVEFRVTYYIV